MARPVKKTLEWYYPRSPDYLLDIYGIPTPGDQWPKWQDEHLSKYKKASSARKMPEFGEEWEKDPTLRLIKKIMLYGNDVKSRLLKFPLIIIKSILFVLILILLVIFELVPTLMLILIKMAFDLVKYIVTRPVDFVKFLGALAVLVIVLLIDIAHSIHALYVGLMIVGIILVGGAFVYDNYVVLHDPVVGLHIKSATGKDMQITNNRTATDVTYEQVLQFLEQDNTDSTIGGYQTVRVEAAVRLHDNAEKAGIRAGVAEVNLDNFATATYCWDVFNTTDQGIVYATAYHPVKNENSDSLIYIPESGENRGRIVFIPLNNVRTMAHDSLTESMGRTSVGGTVSSINIVW